MEAAIGFLVICVCGFIFYVLLNPYIRQVFRNSKYWDEQEREWDSRAKMDEEFKRIEEESKKNGRKKARGN